MSDFMFVVNGWFSEHPMATIVLGFLFLVVGFVATDALFGADDDG